MDLRGTEVVEQDIADLTVGRETGAALPLVSAVECIPLPRVPRERSPFVARKDAILR